MKKCSPGTFLYIIFSACTVAWVLYRSVVLSITNDEAFSFYNVATRHFKMMCGTANTHWLNSVFVLIETSFIGSKEWMIRLHSVAACLIFAYALHRLTSFFIKNSWQLLIPLSMLLMNTYLLDFFSLARGYGLSLAFEMLAFNAIARKDDSVKKNLQVYLYFAFATAACYTCIFIMFAYFLYDVSIHFKQLRFRLLTSKKFHMTLIPFYLITLIAVPNILFIKHSGDLEEGQSNGLLADTFGVFFERSYSVSNSNISVLMAAVLFAGIVAFYLAYSAALHARIKVLFNIFFINVLLIEFAYFFLKIPYVFGRTALYIDSLFLIIIAFMILFILHKMSGRWTIVCSVLFVIAATGNLFFNKNLYTTSEWWKTQGIENVPRDLKKMEGAQMIGKKLAVHLAQLGSYTNYYQYLYPSALNDTVYSFCENKSGIYDAVTLQNLLLQDYVLMLQPYGQYIDQRNYTVLKHYKEMRSDLLKIIK
ncbi:MAG: hypothetical protein IT257_01755 [Chitinophagaceae bacterium]|nr:hypothetical protein [Chitinophagaceae bacterium]